ncbi:MAG TPA: beta-galactosidase [Egibacteraceae bacterium]|nr:beta-galactosidase [Egibacteraceae bacterium]
MTRWPDGGRRLAFGGDYNPEQWDEAVWAEDLRLMQEAGVNLVTVGVFSWALLEPRPGTYEFAWLDRVLDGLAGAGIAVDLATATASPPAWLSRLHPEILPETVDGARMSFGARQAWCPSSSIYRDAATALAEQIAIRYADHPALAMWHVGNEYGCHVARCYCEISAEAFRGWLRRRYRDLDALNDAWGTSFWSQRYHEWDEISPPRRAPTFSNPTQRLDFRRFSSDELLDCYCAERDVLRRHSPDVPITTNFMVSRFDELDYWAWAREVDIVSNDHYLLASDPAPHVELALSADLTRGLAGGAPWLLMEHSPSAVNWQPRNVAKRPGEMRRNSLAHVARGSDGAMFFQWRAAQAGAEKYHSGMVPHAGTDTRVWREVVELGESLGRLSESAGSRVTAEVAMVFDWQARWAVDGDPMPARGLSTAHPTVDASYLGTVRGLYTPLWEAGITVDFVAPDADLSGYRLVLVPMLYLVEDAAIARLERFVEQGGTLLITYFSGIVDANDHIRLGGYPGAFRRLLGVRAEEFFPLRAGETVQLDDGTAGDIWTELLHPDGAEVIASYADGPLPGVPAITRHSFGSGAAWYMATSLDGPGLSLLLRRLVDEAGVSAVVEAPAGVEAVRRRSPDGTTHLFLINHNDADAKVAAKGTDLITGESAEGSVRVPARGVAVVEEVVEEKES